MNDTEAPTPAEMAVQQMLELRQRGQLVAALCNLPAQSARTAIRLITGVDAARAANMWRQGAAPIELNWLGESFTADMLALVEIARQREGIPEWTQERLTVDEIRALLATPWLQPFSTLETLKQALIRIEMERRASM